MSEVILETFDVVEEKVVTQEPLPENVTKLANGTLVIFNKLPQAKAQNALASMMTGLKKKGNSVEIGRGNEFEALINITKYHNELIIGGVRLYGDVFEIATEDELAEIEIYAAGKELSSRMTEYYYLRYFAFTTEEDFELLSSKTLGV